MAIYQFNQLYFNFIWQRKLLRSAVSSVRYAMLNIVGGDHLKKTIICWLTVLQTAQAVVDRWSAESSDKAGGAASAYRTGPQFVQAQQVSISHCLTRTVKCKRRFISTANQRLIDYS